MISYLAAAALLEQNAIKMATEDIAVLDSLDRVSSALVCSPIALPSFNNSAMDGFTLRYLNTVNASQDNPILFLVTDILGASATVLHSADDGLVCNEIMTGAAVPIGFDAVVPLEDVEEIDVDNKHYIKITKPILKKANIRFSGEDVCVGSIILAVGQQIKPCDIALLAALGISTVEVFKPLTVAIASSGDEVRDEYGTALNYGEIYNSNAPLLLNLASAKCFIPRYAGVLRDEEQALYEFINQSSEQILITTGAVSKGKWDFIPRALIEIGATIIFHGVAIRPGKPILFARLKDGRYFFGLPGNPVSSMVGWRFFVQLLIDQMWGKKPQSLMGLTSATTFRKAHKFRQFLKAQLKIDNGKAIAIISDDQESFKIKPLTTNDIWVIVNESQHEILIGDLVTAVPLYS